MALYGTRLGIIYYNVRGVLTESEDTMLKPSIWRGTSQKLVVTLSLRANHRKNLGKGPIFAHLAESAEQISSMLLFDLWTSLRHLKIATIVSCFWLLLFKKVITSPTVFHSAHTVIFLHTYGYEIWRFFAPLILSFFCTLEGCEIRMMFKGLLNNFARILGEKGKVSGNGTDE